MRDSRSGPLQSRSRIGDDNVATIGFVSTRGRLVLVAALLVTASASGCTGDDDTPLLDRQTISADDVKAVEELYLEYWDAVVQAEAELDPDPSRFEAVMTPEAAQEEADFIQGMVDNNLLRHGEPSIGDVTVELDGDRGIAQACVNTAFWLISSRDGAPVRQVLEPGNVPIALSVESQDDGSWLVEHMPYAPQPEATITC